MTKRLDHVKQMFELTRTIRFKNAQKIYWTEENYNDYLAELDEQCEKPVCKHVFRIVLRYEQVIK